MTINLFQTPEYHALMKSHLSYTIAYLFKKDQEFALACEVKMITFNPELPKDLLDSFNDTVLFILSGYTLESAQSGEDTFSFEAGFGPDNFGSMVTIPLLGIQQIFVGDNPIVINHAKPLLDKKEKEEENSNEALKSSSMEALLNNPENKKLFKAKKSKS